MLPDEDDRGQLIVIIALVLGMTFVILALVLNAAIFTENLATRETVNSEGATEYASSIEPAVESDYERTNENATRKAVHAATTFNDSLDVWADEQADRAAREGAIFTANWTTHVGWRRGGRSPPSRVPRPEVVHRFIYV